MSSLRKDFLHHLISSKTAVLLSLILLMGGLIKLHSLQQESKELLGKQQAAQRLHAEVQTLNALVGRLPLTVSLAEANTLTERTENQWQAVAESLVAIRQAERRTTNANTNIDTDTETVTTIKNRLDKIHQLLITITTTVIENRRMKVSTEKSLAIERNHVSLLNIEAIQLATHASSMNADLGAIIEEQSLLIRQMTYLLGGFILLSILLVLLTAQAQFKLLDRRVISRIESMSQQMANDTIAEHLKKVSTSFNDEIDLMHDEFGKLLCRLHEQKNALEVLATTDVLTGLKNRRSIMGALEMEIARASSGHCCCAPSIIMLDIDHFKRINDTYGHGGGDIVLKRIGALITKSIRDADFAGRYGGEEFLLVLPSTDMNDAANLAEKLRKIVADEVFTLDESKNLPFSISISLGVASYCDETAERLLARADAALYCAKEAGRNCVKCALS